MQDAIKKARELLEIVGPLNLAEFEYSDGAVSIKFSREGAAGAPAAVHQPPPLAAPSPTRAAAPATPAAAPAPEKEAENGRGTAIRSPMVGTFYSAPSPDKPPYVSPGDVVEKGQVVCIIEAMKLMNEIKSPARGRIVKIYVENAAPVAKDDPLFQLETV